MNLERLKQINTWPFVEAKRILDDINWTTPIKGYVLFETGYGPSGLPHIGTFGEIVRTSFVIKVFKILAPNIPVKMFCISDDFDGMRKIPENVPNKDMLISHVGKPLTSIPDPFNKHNSYGANMNNRLQTFLNSFGFEYEFISSTEAYKNGVYNETLKKFAKNIDKIKQIVVPTLGDERASTYHPFMPIDEDTGMVIQDGVESVNCEDYTITYLNVNGKRKTQSILDGKCKLQWKADFPMKWVAFDVNYEIYGKDHLPNEPIYQKISRLVCGKNPINYFYELFLDQDGKKISKSKGNGLTIDEWLKYGNKESLAYYMFIKPKTAKKLYFEIIPKTVDEYLTLLGKLSEQDEDQKLENPVFYIPFDNQYARKYSINYSLMLNLAAICNPDNEDIMWNFISRYDKTIVKNDKIFAPLVSGAINYYNDYILPNKNYVQPSDIEKKAIFELKEGFQNNNFNTEIEVQNFVYDIGNKYNFVLKDWFKCLYQALLGTETGPRMGTFIFIYGIENFVKLIEKKII